MEIEKLQDLIKEYLETLDNDESYQEITTRQHFAQIELEDFLVWLKTKE